MTQRITRDELIGSWQILSAVQHFDDGMTAAEFGPRIRGYLIYTAEGTVSAVLGASDRPDISAGDPLDATAEEYEISARRFVAYAGTFMLDEDTGHVHHTIELSLYPNWQGQRQLRLVEFDGDILTITASPRTAADGRSFHSELRWRRAR